MESATGKVVLVTDQPPLSGIGVYLANLYDLLRGSFPEIEVRNLYYFRSPDSPPHQRMPGQQYADSRLGVPRTLRSNERTLARQLAGERALIHLCGASYDLTARVERSVATVMDFGLRTFGSLLSTQPRLLLVEGYSLVDWLRTPRFLRRCEAIVSPSDYTRTRIRAWTGLESTVIPLWVDQDRFRLRSKSDSRTRLGLPLDRRVVLNVATGAAYKNHAMLRRVVEALPPEYLLVRIGHPLPGPPSRVRNEGRVPADRYPHYFDAADAYLHVSLREGFGIPLLESFSSGTPVVALANPPAPEVLGTAACLVPPRASAPEFAAAVRSVVEARDVAAKLTAAGFERLRAFDPARVRTSYTELYLNAMRS